LNSGDVATLLSGTRLAAVESADILSCGLALKLVCARNSDAFVLILNPGWEPSLGGFPALSGAVGQFLIKDVALLGAAIWSLGEALIPKEKPTIEP
jgi:uncharacterized membrane protein YkgB